MKKDEVISIWENNIKGCSPLIGNVLRCSGKNGKLVSRDYIAANAVLSEAKKAGIDYTQMDYYEIMSKLDPFTRFRLKNYSPMLAYRFDELKDDKKEELFTSPNWIFTEKQNGVRGWLMVGKDGFKLFSRNYSDVDCGLIEYSKNIYQTTNIDTKEIYGMDVEIKFEPGADIEEDLYELGLETTSTLEAMTALLSARSEVSIGIQKRYKEKFGKDLICFRCIHPLFYYFGSYPSFNCMEVNLGFGKSVEELIMNRMIEAGLNLKPIAKCAGNKEEKETFLNSIIAAGGEGVVCHNLNSQYMPTDTRSKDGFVKIKRSVGSTDSLGDTIDAFISGWKEGNEGTANEGGIGALQFSIFVDGPDGRKEKVIAYVSGIEDNIKNAMLRKDLSGSFPKTIVLPNGTAVERSIEPMYENLVAEITGQALSSVNQRLEHARLIIWRPEVYFENCVMTQEWLDSQTTNKGIKYN